MANASCVPRATIPCSTVLNRQESLPDALGQAMVQLHWWDVASHQSPAHDNLQALGSEGGEAFPGTKPKWSHQDQNHSIAFNEKDNSPPPKLVVLSSSDLFQWWQNGTHLPATQRPEDM